MRKQRFFRFAMNRFDFIVDFFKLNLKQPLNNQMNNALVIFSKSKKNEVSLISHFGISRITLQLYHTKIKILV